MTPAFAAQGNIVGSIFLAWLVFASGALAAPSVATVKAISVAKTSGSQPYPCHSPSSMTEALVSRMVGKRVL
eukprot:1891836-Rhodomonas_salina.1